MNMQSDIFREPINDDSNNLSNDIVNHQMKMNSTYQRLTSDTNLIKNEILIEEFETNIKNRHSIN